MCPTTGEIRGDDLARTGIDRQVQPPPSPSFRWLSQVANVNPEPCAVDEKMDRSIRSEPAKPGLTEPGQGGMIGDREVHF